MPEKKQKRTAELRVCASCEWIFKQDPSQAICDCPKCGFGHYGARFVYGDAAYRHAKTQKPWFDKKMFNYAMQLQQEIQQSARPQPPALTFKRKVSNGHTSQQA